MEIVARGTARVRVGWPARVLLEPEESGARPWYIAETMDLSRRGVALRWRNAEAEAPRVGQRIWVEVASRGVGLRKVWRWSGLVAYVSHDGAGLRIGVSFNWPLWNGFRTRAGGPSQPRERLMRIDRVRQAPPLPLPPVGRAEVAWRTPARRVCGPRGALWVALGLALLGLAVDQVSKGFVAQSASSPGSFRFGAHTVHIGPVAANAGVFGGLGHAVPGTGLVSAISGLAIVVILSRWAWRDSLRWGRRDALGWGLVLAGLSGNLADRLILGHVRDFLRASFWPGWTFNVADMLAVAGAGVLLAASVPALAGWKSLRPSRPTQGNG